MKYIIKNLIIIPIIGGFFIILNKAKRKAFLVEVGNYEKNKNIFDLSVSFNDSNNISTKRFSR